MNIELPDYHAWIPLIFNVAWKILATIQNYKYYHALCTGT